MGTSTRPIDDVVIDIRARSDGEIDLDAVEWQEGWKPRRAVSVGLAVLVELLPLVVSAVVTIALGPSLLVGSGSWGTALSFVLLAGLAFVVAESTLRLLRALSPYALLLRLGVAFPGVVPSRFAVALRAGNSRRLDAPGSMRNQPPDEVATVILALVTRLGSHDRATRGHSERVRAYTELIAHEMGLGRSARHRLRWAGLVHDVGKLRTPAEILNKLGELDDGEWEAIRRHPVDGMELAIPLWPWLGRDVLAVSDHHERWEGGGYPMGIAGEEISLAGRAVAVADAFDVMTSARSYQAPIPVEEARAELAVCAGTQFDPDVVRAFLSIPVRRLRAITGPFPILLALLSTWVGRAEATWMRHAVSSAVVAALALGPLGLGAPDDGDARDAVAAAPADGAGAATGGAGGRDGTETGDDPESATGDGATGLGGGESGTAIVGTPPVSVLGDVAPEPGSGARPDRRDPGPTGDDDPSPDRGPTPPPGPSPGPGPGPGPGPSPSPGDPVRIVIDPEEGSVDVEGVGPPDGVELVEAPATGPVVCGEAGVCEPIEVTLPIEL